MSARHLTLLAVFLMAALPAPGAPAGQQLTPVLYADSFRHYVNAFNQNDEELYTQVYANTNAWAFLKANIPLLDCPDKEIEETYYFRWWTFRKHVKQTPEGFVITEFLPQVSWSGKYNTINCAAGHHFYEGRRLKDPKYLNDYARFWFRKDAGKGGEERGKDYNHSTYCDLVISGLIGLRLRPDERVEVNPLVPLEWDAFCLDRIPYHGHSLTILWDKTGQRYRKGKGLRVFADGQEIASSPKIGRLAAHL